MQLGLRAAICLAMILGSRGIFAGELQEQSPEKSEAEMTRAWEIESLDWQARSVQVEQILTSVQVGPDKVGYQIGSLDALNAALKPAAPLIHIETSGEDHESGFGSDTINWSKHVIQVEAVQTEGPGPDSGGVENLLYQVPAPSADSEAWPADLIFLNPDQVFSPPMDPRVRAYVPGPPDPIDPPPPKLKSLWEEYTDWLHSGFVGWTERLELGGAFLEGNTNQEVFNTAARFSRDTEFITTQINVGGNHAQSKKAVTQNRWYGDTTTDFKHKGNWLYFVRTLHEYDQFTNLDYRGTASFGMGYRFFNEEYRKLIVRYGPGVTQEVFHSPRVVRTSPDLFAEIESIWPIGPRVIFEEKATLHPNITNFGMLRVLNTTGFLIPLDDQKRWNLKVGFRFEYNGRPNANRQPSDFATNVNIVYSRK